MTNNFVDNANTLWKETEEWKNKWQHRKPCRDWKEHEKTHGSGFCKHYVEARYKKYKERIVSLFDLSEK
jgi:hypothetical protein